MIQGSLYDAHGTRRVPRCYRAESWWDRMRGLLGRAPLAADEGMLIVPCGAVHTFGMRYPIDVVYLDRALNILKCVENLLPWRMSACPSAHATLELAAGAVSQMKLVPRISLKWQLG